MIATLQRTGEIIKDLMSKKEKEYSHVVSPHMGLSLLLWWLRLRIGGHFHVSFILSSISHLMFNTDVSSCLLYGLSPLCVSLFLHESRLYVLRLGGLLLSPHSIKVGWMFCGFRINMSRFRSFSLLITYVRIINVVFCIFWQFCGVVAGDVVCFLSLHSSVGMCLSVIKANALEIKSLAIHCLSNESDCSQMLANSSWHCVIHASRAGPELKLVKLCFRRQISII